MAMREIDEVLFAKKDGSVAYIKKQTQCLFRPRAYSGKEALRHS